MSAPPSEELVARSVAAMPVGLAVVRDGLFVFVNPAFCQMVGHPEASLLGKDAFSFVDPEEMEAVRQRHAARQRGEPVPPQYEVTCVTADGVRRRAELEPKVLTPHETLIVLRTLGARAQDRELLTALGALQTRVQQQRSVAGVLEVAVQGLRNLGFDACVGQLIGEECVMVASGFHPEVQRLAELIFKQGPRGPVIPVSRIPITHAAIHLGQPFFRDDASDALARLAHRAGVSPEQVARIRERVQPLQATISPLSVRGRGWGVLMALASGLRSNDAAALALFATQVASSIEVAQYIQNLEAIHQVASFGAELSQEELLQRLLPLLCQATQSEICTLYLLAPEGDALQLAASNSDPRITARHLRIPLPQTAGPDGMRARALSVEDLPEPAQSDAREEGCLQLAMVPLAVEGRLGGTLFLCRQIPLPFSEAELRSAEMLAAQVALQLERVRLYEEARRRVSDLSLINELGSKIALHLGLEDVFQVAVRHVARIVQVQNTFLLLADASGRRLRIEASNTTAEGLEEVLLPVDGQSAAAETFRQLTPVVIQDASQDSRADSRLVDRFGHRALMAVPLLANGKAIGALVLGETRSARRFAPYEVERAVEVANQLAAAIANGRLFEDLKRSYQDLSHAQQELVKRERLAALGELSALVAHEVRNPLGVIFNSISSLKRFPAPGGEHGRSLLRVVEEEAERLDRMVNDLLDFAGPSSARVRPEKLELVVSGAMEAAVSTIPSSHVRIELTVASDLPEIRVDSQMLRQAVVNLVVNAIQAMPAGGVVKIRAGREERSTGPMARLDVEDNGPGMAESVAARAFEPFFTTRAAGTGLGLAVVKRIAEAHGGEVAIATAPGQGATFTLLLPL